MESWQMTSIDFDHVSTASTLIHCRAISPMMRVVRFWEHCPLSGCERLSGTRSQHDMSDTTLCQISHDAPPGVVLAVYLRRAPD